jgi:HAMP domain-containing protein
MSDGTKDNHGMKGAAFSFPIPIFYKLLASMLFTAVIPVIFLGIVSTGDTQSVVAGLGMEATIFILTISTLSIVVAWSFYLSRSIVGPIEHLTDVARNVSMGDLRTTEIEVTSNDEIGELTHSFNRMIRSYKVLDNLAQDPSK